MTRIIADQIIKEAEGWYKIYKTSPLSDADRGRFTDWYKKDANHPLAFEQVFIAQESGVDFSKSDFAVPHNGTIRSVEKGVKTKGGFFGGWFGRPALQFGGMAAVCLLLITYVYPLLYPLKTIDYSTKVAQIETIDLMDGSRVILGAGSAIRVAEFSDSKRTVYLDKGEALFSVAKDPSRPFIVISGETEVRVLGTKFNINKSSEDLTVSLIEGRVRVVQEEAGSIIAFLTTDKVAELEPAQSISVHGGVLQQAKPQDVEIMGNWVKGQFTYNDASLKRLVDDLNRYYTQPVRLVGQGLKDHKVTVTFGLEQMDNMINSLPYLLPVNVEKDSSGAYIIRPRQNKN